MIVERRLKSFSLGLIAALLLLPLIVGSVAATEDLSLPSTLVVMEVFNGTESYFNTVLSDVPSGYDVENGTYAGWCVDVRTPMARSPAKHKIRLYSSLNPPGELAVEQWDMVNYILNHKQGTMEDVQQAIWYFVHMDGGYTPNRAVAWTIVNDALTNGEGFVPAYGNTVAVICYPELLFPSEEVQISIIEVNYPIIPELQPTTIALTFLTVSTIVLLALKKNNRHVREAYQ